MNIKPRPRKQHFSWKSKPKMPKENRWQWHRWWRNSVQVQSWASPEQMARSATAVGLPLLQLCPDGTGLWEEQAKRQKLCYYIKTLRSAWDESDKGPLVCNHLYPTIHFLRLCSLWLSGTKTNRQRTLSAPWKCWPDFPVGGTDFPNLYLLPISLLSSWDTSHCGLLTFTYSTYHEIHFSEKLKCQDPNKLGGVLWKPWWRAYLWVWNQMEKSSKLSEDPTQL